MVEGSAAGVSEPNIDPRLIRLRVELFTAQQTCKGADLEFFNETVEMLVQTMDIEPKPKGLLSPISIELNIEDRKRLEALETLVDDLDRRGGLGHDVHERIARTLGVERLVELRTREVREQIERRFK